MSADRFTALLYVQVYGRFKRPEPRQPITDRRVPADEDESPTFGRARAAAQAAGKAAQDGEI